MLTDRSRFPEQHIVICGIGHTGDGGTPTLDFLPEGGAQNLSK